MIAGLWDRVREAIPLRILDRYLLRHFLIAYAVCGAAILGLFVVIEGLSRLEYFLKQDGFLGWVLLRYFAATIPIYFSQYFGPILTLMAAMFAVTMLNKGCEIVPMRDAGLSTARILAPFFLAALVVATLMVFVQELVIPQLKDPIRVSTAYGKKNKGIRPEPYADNLGNKITVAEYYPDSKKGLIVSILTRHDRKKNQRREYIDADEIVLVENDGEPYWLLKAVRVERRDEQGQLIANPDADSTADNAFLFHHDSMVFTTDMRPIDLESSDRDIPYLSFGEIRDQHNRRPHLTHLRVKMHTRFAFPLANVVLLLLGIPFIMRRGNNSVLIGVGMAILISAAYLLLSTISADLGNKGVLPAELAAWLPVLFFGALGLVLFDGIDS